MSELRELVSSIVYQLDELAERKLIDDDAGSLTDIEHSLRAADYDLSGLLDYIDEGRPE